MSSPEPAEVNCKGDENIQRAVICSRDTELSIGDGVTLDHISLCVCIKEDRY